MQPSLPPTTSLPFSVPQMLCGLALTALFFAGLVVDIVLLTQLSSLRRRWRDGVAALRLRHWSDAEGIGVFVTMGWMVLLLMALVNGARALGILEGTPLLLFSLLLQSLLVHGGAAALIAALIRRRGTTWRHAFGNFAPARRHIRHGLVLYLAILPPVTIAGLVSRTILDAIGFPMQTQFAIAIFTDTHFPILVQVALMIWASLVAPVVEELAFRGVALPAVAKRASVLRAILVVSIFFAAIHCHLPAILPLTVIAVGFAAAYIYTGSIITPIVMHVLFNAVNLTVVILLRDSPALDI